MNNSIAWYRKSPRLLPQVLVLFARLLVLIGFLSGSKIIFAVETLPYTTRTHSYSGTRTGVQGDLRIVGMAGGSVGLGNTYLSTVFNPATLAMTLNGADANFASNQVHDASVQNYDEPLMPFSFGLAVAPYPWGGGVSYSSRPLESQEYSISGFLENPVKLSIFANEYYFSLARVFFDNKLSVGGSLIFGQMEEQATWASSSLSQKAYALGASIGMSWQFPNRVMLGLGVTTAAQYGFTSQPGTPLTGFFKDVEVPFRVGLGLAWMPNRFFMTDVSAYIIGTDPNAALLRDDTTRVGQFLTIQPKVGFAYRLIDYQQLSVTLNMGTYLEFSRIQNFPNRLHFTSSVEVNPWILFFGMGFDTSYQYGNYILSFGLNIIKTMQALDLVPRLSHSVHRGILPSPNRYFDTELPRPLVKWRPKGQEIDALAIGLRLPGLVGQKIEDIGEGIRDLVSPERPKRRVLRKNRAIHSRSKYRSRHRPKTSSKHRLKYRSKRKLRRTYDPNSTAPPMH